MAGRGGPIDVWDVTDLDAPTKVVTIEAPDRPGAFRTSHNFDLTANRLHSSWYEGGVRIHDITDPANPEEIASYRPEGSPFWTAVRSRGFTIASDIGGGIVFLHDDPGAMQSPEFDGDSAPGRSPGAKDHARPD